MDGFMVTPEWIHANKSKNGGWNRVQLAAIGIEWPPARGWTREVEGFLIPQSHKEIFEAGEKVSMRQSRKIAKQLLETLREWRGD